MADTIDPTITAPAAPTLQSSGVQQLSDPLNTVLGTAPELGSDPGAAVSVAASGGNVALKARAVAQQGNRTAIAKAADDVHSAGGIFSDIIHDAGWAVGKVAHLANVGLETVQQEYRYLHDVEARHGIGAAMVEGAGIIAGAAAGGAAGLLEANPLSVGEGAILGAETVTRLEGLVAYKDSWKRAANPNYRDPHTGQLVSFGRDVTSALGISGGARTLVSGALDGLADLYADPLANIGKAYGVAHDLDMTPEQVEQGYRRLRGVRIAFQDMADSDATEIVAKYGSQFAGIAKTLEAETTAEGIKDVFVDLTGAQEMLKADRIPSDPESVVENPIADITRVPTRTTAHRAAYWLRTAARNAGGDEAPTRLGQLLGPANSKIFGVRTWANRFESVAGNTYDRASTDLSGTSMNPADDKGAQDIYRTMRYGLSDRSSKAVEQAYLDATVGERRMVIRNGIMKMLLTRAHVPTPDIDDIELTEENPAMKNSMEELANGPTKKAFWKRLDSYTDHVVAEGAPPNSSMYGTEKGELVPPVVDTNGVEQQAAIRKNQVGKITLPNFHEAKRMAQAIRSGRTSRFLSGVDDFLYDHVTQGFFKPLVLLSGGYALHISLSELIPNTLREGVGKSAVRSYQQAVASLGYAADEDEQKGFLSWLYDVAGARAMAHSDAARDGAKLYAKLGYRRTLAAAAGRATTEEIKSEQAVAGLREAAADTLKTGDKFAGSQMNDERFIPNWQASLSEAAKDPWTIPVAEAYRRAWEAGGRVPGTDIEANATEVARQEAKRVLSYEPQNVLDNYERQKYPMKGAPLGWTPMDGHAAAIVAALKGDVHGAQDAAGNSGPLNEDLLWNIIHQRAPSRAELEAKDIAMRPSLVKGRMLVPSGEGSVQRFANVGFQKVIDPMVNMISRNRTFFNEFLDAYEPQKQLVELGYKTDDQAMDDAISQATVHMMRFVHNLKDRTQWTDTMRNWVPFFFAQEQAYRRMGRLLAEDPGAFRRYQMMITFVAGYSNTAQDSTGNQYLIFPGSGLLGKGVADAMGMHGLTLAGVPPAAFGGSFTSANVIFPLSQGFAPDLGPVATLPATQLSAMFAELGKDYSQFRPVSDLAASGLADAAGSYAMSQPVWQQLIPNSFAANVIEAFAGNSRAFNSSVMQAYQLADYEQAEAEQRWIKDGRKGEAPQIIPAADASAQVKQNFANKIRNMVRALYLTRAIVAMASPVSADVEIQNFNFPAELTQEINKAGSVDAGMQAFLLKNPDAVPYTVAQSYVPSDVDVTQPSGVTLPASTAAQQWVEANQNLINQYGNAAMWLMPQLKDNKYSASVYNEQIAQGLRVKDTPQQFLNALYNAAGDNLYYAGLTIHENAIASMGDNSAAKNDEYNSWNQWVTLLEKQNPVWAEQHFSADRQTNTQQVIAGLAQMINNGDAPVGDQTTDVEFLLAQYQLAAANYQQVGSAGTSYTSQIEGQDAVNANWLKYLSALAVSKPNLKPIIDTIFKGALVATT